MGKRTDKLDEYNRRRDFTRSPEPAGKPGRPADGALAFLVQKHAARRLHYDLRLEWDGVLKSWAVTRGPSPDPADKRLAVRTEDHPLSYGDFEGVIPEGQYGAGTVMLWDRGTWEPLHDPEAGLAEGKLHFRLHGQRMQGGWALVRMRGRKAEKRENWLLIKENDELAGQASGHLIDQTASVKTGRAMADIAAGRDATGPPAPGAAARRRRSKAGAAGTGPPDFQAVQLATLVSDAPDGDDWVSEVKFDGYRCLSAIGDGRVRCYTRSGLDWTDRFTGLAQALAGLDCRSALVDGEVVAAGGGSGSQFSALQRSLADGGPLKYYLFDLLSLDGEDLRGRPLVARKDALHALLRTAPAGGPLLYSEHVRGHASTVFARLCQAGQEGIIAKRADAPYVAGRSKAWLKVKCTRRQEFVIGGYCPSTKPGRPFASLLVGTFDGDVLRYRGRVGTGFSEDTLETVRSRLAARKRCPFAAVPAAIARNAVWVAPTSVAEIEFAELTDEGHIRHGSFIALREDKDAKAVMLETPSPDPGDGPRDDALHGVRLTHPDRVVFEAQGLTKLDLARYYGAVAPRMLPLAGRRPLSLVRCPGGRGGKCFFQKHAGDGFPHQLQRVDVTDSAGETAGYITVDDAAGLIAGVQMGTLEFHIWGARNDRLEYPDRLVFDLDPDEGLAFRTVVDAAVFLRDRLAALGLETVPMVTGGKGIHVIAPLKPETDWPRVKDFARSFAGGLAAENPDRFTATLSKAKRKGRIFIDWLRNERGSTAVAPYSTRARPGAPVAMPVSWKELGTLPGADAFTTADVVARLDQDDPWADAASWTQVVPGPP